MSNHSRLFTGASSGIGLELAATLRRRGSICSWRPIDSHGRVTPASAGGATSTNGRTNSAEKADRYAPTREDSAIGEA